MGSGHTAWRRGVAAAILLAFASGCASTYVPRPGPRLSLVMDGGNYAYVRDGKKYEGGLFGGDIVAAVRDNPQAEDYARAYKAGVTTGIALTFVGAAAALGGLGILGADVAQHSSGQSTRPTGFIVIGSGLLVELVGAIIVANAVPHLFDAVNAYNDAVGPNSDAPSAPALR